MTSSHRPTGPTIGADCATRSDHVRRSSGERSGPHDFRAFGVAAQLDLEWSRLRHARAALAEVRSWAELAPVDLASVLVDVEDLDQLLVATSARRGSDGEHLLRWLISIADAHRLAGRIVVQRLLPGVVTATIRYRQLCDHDDPVSEALGSLWPAIAAFDGDRRGGSAAAAVISDTMYAAFRRRTRLRSADEDPVEPRSLDDSPAASPRCGLVELADIVATARRAGVPTFDIDLIRHLVQAESPGRVARERQITPRTVRNHRDRAIERVRAAVGIVAAA